MATILKLSSLIAGVGLVLSEEVLGPITPNCKLTSGYSVTSTKKDILYVYEHAKNDFNALIDGYKGDRFEEFWVSDIFGNTMRATFHDCGEFLPDSEDNYGCDGCFSDTEANAGLLEDDAIILTFIEDIWQKYCDKITRADFWVLIGKFVAEKGDPTKRINIPFSYGRPDNTKGCTANAEGRLPNHQIGFSEYTRVFVDQMQMTLRQGVACTGAHTVGRVDREYSGFGFRVSPWTQKKNPTTNAWDETPAVFDNEYFISLVMEPWVNIQRGGDRSKNFWEVDEENHEHTIMLNSDMVLAFFPNVDPDLNRDPTGSHIGINGELCATDAIPCELGHHSSSSSSGCYGCFHQWKNNPGKGGWPITYDQCKEYIESNELFLQDFAEAYYAMSNVGFSVDGYAPAGKSTKLGNLKSIELPYYHGYLAEEGAAIESSATVTVDTGSGSSSSSNYALPLIIGASIFTVGGAGLVLFNKKSQQKTPAESENNDFIVA